MCVYDYLYLYVYACLWECMFMWTQRLPFTMKNTSYFVRLALTYTNPVRETYIHLIIIHPPLCSYQYCWWIYFSFSPISSLILFKYICIYLQFLHLYSLTYSIYSFVLSLVQKYFSIFCNWIYSENS